MPDEASTPDAEALLAGTLALMTAWAHPSPEAKLAPEALQSLLRKKIISNLFFLQHHPLISPHLRQVASNVHGQWHAALCMQTLEDKPTSGPAPTDEQRSALH
ncbi:MAG: hypothetical protein C4K60_02720 [Ideonella sp. MAG2]|nr:MAG: hypothetical protein C4K60_02720 [Ideonella sp. MAG2]